MVHLLLAVVLTLFLVVQAGSVAYVIRYRRAGRAARPPGRADLLWTTIPVLVVLFLAARSWMAVFDVERPAVASAITTTEPAEARPAPPR